MQKSTRLNFWCRQNRWHCLIMREILLVLFALIISLVLPVLIASPRAKPLLALPLNSTPSESRYVARAQQSPLDWSPTQLIIASQEGTSEPDLFADASGLVHLFWSPYASETQSLFYSRWNGNYWTDPVDIFFGVQILGPKAVVSPDGTLHLIWGDGSAIYYSQAPVSKATSARYWSTPIAIGSGYAHADLMIDEEGILYVVFAGLTSSGPQMVISEDNGDTWSDIMPISFTNNSGLSAEYVNGAVGIDGTIHVVWVEYQLPQGWPPAGIYYAQSKDQGNSWSRPTSLAGEGSNQANILVAGNEVHVAWNGIAGVGGRYHRWSEDGGNTWSALNTIIPAGLGGSEGVPPLVIDSLGTLHLLTTFDQRVWYLNFRDSGAGKRWSIPQYIPSGAESGIPPSPLTIDPLTQRRIEYPAMSLNQGNTLHVVFWDERPTQQITQYWYTVKQTSAPLVEPISFPTPTSELQVRNGAGTPPPEIGSSASLSGNSTTQVEIDTQSKAASSPSLSSTSWPILIAILPVMILVVAISAAFILKRS